MPWRELNFEVPITRPRTVSNLTKAIAAILNMKWDEWEACRTSVPRNSSPTKFIESPKKGKRYWVKAQKRSTKSTVDSKCWVMTWLESIFQIVFEPWVDLKQNFGKFFESWVNLNQNILEAFWVVSRFESNLSKFIKIRNLFWVVSWLKSILVKPLWVMGWVETKFPETEMNRVKKWVVCPPLS